MSGLRKQQYERGANWTVRQLFSSARRYKKGQFPAVFQSALDQDRPDDLRLPTRSRFAKSQTDPVPSAV